VHSNSFRDVPNRWHPDPAWLSITCSKQKSYIDRFERPRVYDPRQVKATDICDFNICYSQHLMANIIFGRNDSQNVCRKAELFFICCALTGAYADTGVFIIHHLVEVAKTTHENIIGVGGTIIAVAQALGHRGKFGSLEGVWI